MGENPVAGSKTWPDAEPDFSETYSQYTGV